MANRQKAEGTPSGTGKSLEEEIRSLAYQLYCEGGYQNNRGLEYWLKAEQRVIAGNKAHLRKVA